MKKIILIVIISIIIITSFILFWPKEYLELKNIDSLNYSFVSPPNWSYVYFENNNTIELNVTPFAYLVFSNPNECTVTAHNGTWREKPELRRSLKRVVKL